MNIRYLFCSFTDPGLSKILFASTMTSQKENELKFVSTNFCTNIPIFLPIKDDPLREKSLAQMGYDPNNMPNWGDISQPKKLKLESLLLAKIQKYEQTNVEIHIEGTIFRCHMLVLQCYSEYFSESTGKEKIVLPSNRVTPQSFFMLYSWMLSPDPIVGREGILELYNAAEYLKIDGVLSQCWACLDDAQISEDAAFLLYLEARQFRKSLIEELMIARIFKFFLTLVASEEFLKFAVDEVILLLNSNSIGVHSEMEVIIKLKSFRVSTVNVLIGPLIGCPVDQPRLDGKIKILNRSNFMRSIRIANITTASLVEK